MIASKTTKSWPDRHPVAFGLGMIWAIVSLQLIDPMICPVLAVTTAFPLLWIMQHRKINTWTELWYVLKQPVGGNVPRAKARVRAQSTCSTAE